MLANPPLGGAAPIRAIARPIGHRLAGRFLRTYEQRSGQPVDGRRLACVHRAHALRALVEIATETLGYTTIGGAGSYVMLVDAEGIRPKLLLQAVPEAKSSKNRMHLDIETADVNREASRLESLGATRLEAGTHHEHETNWVVMADPEGNEFCVCDGGSGS
jgi:hypothetical protein